MTTKITFEISTLADVVRRAGTVAPNKAGNSFDKAAGVVLDITPNEDAKCVIRSTDLTTYFMEVVDAVGAEGDDVRWRLPARPLEAILVNQAGANKQVTIEHTTGGRISITAGRLRGSLALIDNSGYPDFVTSDEISFVSASLLGPAIERVAWAADKAATDVLSGIYFDGSYITAGTRQRIARVPMEMALTQPVTVPPGALAGLLRQRGDVQVGIDGTMLVIEPDEFTQICTTTYGTPYPNVAKICVDTFEQQVEVRRDALIASINSASAVAGADRMPRVALYFGGGLLAVFMENDEVGKVGDIIDLPGQANHERIEIGFSQGNLLDALNHAPGEKVTIKYNQTNHERSIVCVDGGSGYMVWLAPRKKHGA